MDIDPPDRWDHGRPHAAPHATSSQGCAAHRHREGFEADLSAPVVAAGNRSRTSARSPSASRWAGRCGGAGGRLRGQLGELRLGFTQLAALYVLADAGTITIGDSPRPSAAPRRRRSRLDRRPGATATRGAPAEPEDRRQRTVWLTPARPGDPAGRGSGARRSVPDRRCGRCPARTGDRGDGRRRARDPCHQPPWTVDPGSATDARTPCPRRGDGWLRGARWTSRGPHVPVVGDDARRDADPHRPTMAIRSPLQPAHHDSAARRSGARVGMRRLPVSGLRRRGSRCSRPAGSDTDAHTLAHPHRRCSGSATATRMVRGARWGPRSTAASSTTRSAVGQRRRCSTASRATNGAVIAATGTDGEPLEDE